MAKARGITGRGGRPRRRRHKRTAFASWLESQGRPVAEVAEDLGVSASTVYSLRNRYHSPSRALAIRIEELSGGAVPVKSWDR